MIQRRNIAPWGIPIFAAAFLAACAAVLPATAGGTGPFSKPIIAPVVELVSDERLDSNGNPRIPKCYPSLSAAAAQLLHTWNETPLVGVFRGGTEEKPHWVLSIFVNPETGTWSILQSDSQTTCGVRIFPGAGGIIFDMERLVEDSRIRNIGTES